MKRWRGILQSALWVRAFRSTYWRFRAPGGQNATVKVFYSVVFHVCCVCQQDGQQSSAHVKKYCHARAEQYSWVCATSGSRTRGTCASTVLCQCTAAQCRLDGVSGAVHGCKDAWSSNSVLWTRCCSPCTIYTAISKMCNLLQCLFHGVVGIQLAFLGEPMWRSRVNVESHFIVAPSRATSIQNAHVICSLLYSCLGGA